MTGGSSRYAPPQAHRARMLLLTAAVIAVLLGASRSLTTDGGAGNVARLPADAAAVVNGRTIRTEELERAVDLLRNDKRNPLTPEDESRVLRRLVEEELLIQRGVDMGLVDTDRAVRRAITGAIVASVIAESASKPPSREELEAFREKRLRENGNQAAGSRSPAAQPFEDIREAIEEAYIDSLRKKALRDYVDWLRYEADITLLAGAKP